MVLTPLPDSRTEAVQPLVRALSYNVRSMRDDTRPGHPVIPVDQRQEPPQRVGGVQRHLGVPHLVVAGQRDVVGHALRRPHQMTGDRQRVRREAVHLVGRVDQHQTADRVAVLGREPQGQRPAHGEPEDEDPLALPDEDPQLPVHLRVPAASRVTAMSSQRVPWPWQQRQRDRQPPLGEVVGQAQRLRGSGEAMTEEDADLSALVAGTAPREDRHQGLLFVGRGGGGRTWGSA
ncbi:hypothetical protein SCALM49S_06663 [Streptomyces californicus]